MPKGVLSLFYVAFVTYFNTFVKIMIYTTENRIFLFCGWGYFCGSIKTKSFITQK